ncbi:MAG: hypothetical protein WDM70_09070, partial [Nitrosomonadales bacterium]
MKFGTSFDAGKSVVAIATFAMLFVVAGEIDVWGKTLTPSIPQSNDMAKQQLLASPQLVNSPVALSKLPVTAKASEVPRHHLAGKHLVAPSVVIPTVATSESSDISALSIRVEHNFGGDEVSPVLLAAWQAYLRGDFDAASGHYSEVLRQDVKDHNLPNRDALLGMAAIAQQRAQDVIAAQYYNQILAMDPRDPDAQAGMSSLHSSTGTADEESRLKLLLVQRPEAASLNFALGNCFAEMSRWGDAEQAYFNASQLESDNAGLFSIWQSVLIILGRKILPLRITGAQCNSQRVTVTASIACVPNCVWMN